MDIYGESLVSFKCIQIFELALDINASIAITQW